MTETIERRAADVGEVVAFTTAGQEFCIDILSVREIRGWSQPTIIPRAPDYILGVINLRGAVIPIMNLSLRLGLPPTLPSERSVIIIVVISEQTVGLLVDAVFDLLNLRVEDTQATPRAAEQSGDGFVSAIISLGNRMIRQIDPEMLLVEQEIDA